MVLEPTTGKTRAYHKPVAQRKPTFGLEQDLGHSTCAKGKKPLHLRDRKAEVKQLHAKVGELTQANGTSR